MTSPEPQRRPIEPALVDPAFDDPEAVIALTRASSPYRLAAAVHDSGASGADVPWFRTYWARDGALLEPAAAPMLHNPRFIEAAKAVFGASVIKPLSLMNNLNAPMGGGSPHVDLPRFRGGEAFPLDLLMAMSQSGLFADWAVPIASTITWFYRGEGGDFAWWPDGAGGRKRLLHSPLWNVALAGDNETMIHQMGPVGRAADRMSPGDVSRGVRLLADEDGPGWTLIDGEAPRRFGADDIRISFLWKAYAFESEREQARFEDREDDLTLPMALSIIDGDLKRRGLPRLDLEAGYDATARLRVHAAYPPPRLNQA